MKLIVTKAGKISNSIKHAFNLKNLAYDDITIDFENECVYVYEQNSAELLDNQHLIDERYLKTARTIVREHLPAEYRLRPQTELKFQNVDDRTRLVIEFESAKSKQINGTNQKPTDFKIPLMTDVYWDISKEPHALITGVTGSGKSMFINYLFKSFKQLNSEIYTIDPKLADLYAISKRELPKSNYAVSTDDVIALLQHLNQRLDERQYFLSKYHDNIGVDAYKVGMTPIVLFYDELAAFTMTLDKKQKSVYEKLLKNLILKGRSASINIVLAMQKPLATTISTDIRDQLSFRLVLGKNTPKDTRRIVFGITDNNIVMTDNIPISDEWETDKISEFGGWYSLPKLTEEYAIFETPNLTNLKI